MNLFWRKKNKEKKELETEEGGSRKRELEGFWGKYIYVAGLIMTLFHIYVLVISPISHWNLYCLHILFGFLLVFPLYKANRKSKSNAVPWYDVLLMLAGTFAIGYCLKEATGMAYRMGSAPVTMDLIAIGIIIVLLLEGTRRIFGNILPIIGILFLLYCRFGKYIPGALGHRGYSWKKIISYMLSYEAVFSSPMNASATMVFLFIVFGAFLHMSGAGPYFIDMAMSVAGSKRGGPAKVAVISSALFGTVSGNSVANVVSTGSFTIPMMKSVGYEKKFAGAVEATASTGGQIMPPILGSAAFIMSEMISKPYSDIMKASIIPALLFFFTVFMIVDIEAAKKGLKGMEKEKLPSRSYVLKNIYMLLPLLILIITLTVLGNSPIRAAFYGILTCIAVYIVKERKFSFKLLLDTMSQGARSACGMICACGTAGIVVGVLNMTGAGIKFASFVFEASHGILMLGLLLTMLASLILGMGLPTSASYIICAAVAAPALIEMGLSDIQAHMFVFYFACISAITPPVAMAAYAGASISGAKPMEVGFTACKLGICAFIVPFMFCFAPSLLWIGSFGTILGTIVTALIGATLLSYGLQRFVGCFSQPIGPVFAGILIALALLLITPDTLTDIIGILGGAAVLYVVSLLKKRGKAVP
ncbi:MAG: TRAP transporter permease [Lachnospiraceae bacterium]|nr:TRAP transporter permease [Lachnospiraceae bacterium]